MTLKNLRAAERVLNRQFDGTQSVLLSRVAPIDTDNLLVDRVVTKDVVSARKDMIGSAELSERQVAKGRMTDVSIRLSKPIERKDGSVTRTIELATGFWVPALYRDHGGWDSGVHLLTRGLAARSPEMRRVAAVLAEVLERSRLSRRGARHSADILKSIERELRAISRA